MSGEPSKSRGFILAPSRLSRAPALGDGDKNAPIAKPLFSGLKASKLGVLTDSNLKPPGGDHPDAPPATENGASDADSKKQPDDKNGDKVKTGGFSFTPLTKLDKTDSENGGGGGGGKEKEKEGGLFVFGEKLASRVENVSDKQSENVAKSPGVFGENLSDRVTNGNGEEATDNDSSDTATTPTKVTSSSPTKATDSSSPVAPPQQTTGSLSPKSGNNMFFSSASTPGKEIVPQNKDDESCKKSLSEAAAEYTESRSNKRKYEEVTVVTGEEEEQNVLNINVKLYLFIAEGKNWTERGRGTLRLNDAPASTPGHLKSRLVMRTSGSLRVVLNTKLWPEMVCQRPNEKSLRITAMDGEEVRVFLISASPKDTDKLFTALEYRLSQLKTDKECSEPPEKKAAEGE